MKNKFLLMSVVSALFALVVVPSAMAQTSTTSGEVNTYIQSGLFTIQANGIYTSELQFSLTAPPVTTETASVTGDASGSDYFIFTDGTATQGGKIAIYLDDDFSYVGDANQSNIPASNMYLGAENGAAPTISSAAGATATIVAGSTAGAGTSLSMNPALYGFSGASDTTEYYHTSTGGYDYMVAAGTASDDYYFGHIADNPLKVNVGLEKLKLDVPGGSNAGTYVNRIHVVITDNLTDLANL